MGAINLPEKPTFDAPTMPNHQWYPNDRITASSVPTQEILSVSNSLRQHQKRSKEPVGEAFFHFITRGGKHVLRHEFAEQPISCLRPCSTWGGPHPQPSVGHNYKDYYHYAIWHENYVWIGIEPRERASAGMSRNCQAKGSTWESPTTYLPRHSLNPLATENSSVTLRENC